MITNKIAHSIPALPKSTSTFGLLCVYALLLFPVVIATPKTGLTYLIARSLQLFSIVVWGMLYITKRQYTQASHKLFIYASHAWWIILIAITFMRVPVFQLTQINYWLIVWNILLIAELYWTKDLTRHLYTLSVLFSGLIYLSSILFILYPNGLWFEEGWMGAGEKTRYLFGNYNQTGFISLIALMICGTYTLLTGRGYINLVILSLTSIATVIAMGSMTSSVGLVLVTLYFLLQRFVKFPYVWIGVYLMVYVAFFSIIVWQGDAIQNWPIASSFVENVLGKDSTFSLRIYLWMKSIPLIKASPWIGYGVQGVEWMMDYIGGSGPHNIWLMALLEGGLVLCMLLAAIIAIIFVAAIKSRTPQSAFASVCICIALLMSLFETYHFVNIFIILIIAYYTCVIKLDSQHKQTTPVIQS